MDSEERKERILEMQFESAMNGSVEMLKWLGIQYCGQDNKPTKASEPLPTGFNVSIIKSREQEEFEEYRDEFLEWRKGRDD